MKWRLIIFLIFVASLGFSQSLKVKVCNKTGFDVDSIRLGPQYFSLQKDSNRICDHLCLLFEGSMLLAYPGGKIKNHPEMMDGEPCCFCIDQAYQSCSGYLEYFLIANKSVKGLYTFDWEWHYTHDN